MSLLEELDFAPLQQSKNLLAFSAGIDSTALFFLLHEANIDFDIAIVNYNTRKNSLKELAYAKELASRYEKNIYVKEAQLEASHLEASARKIRYDFFEEIIESNNYDLLLTAHQINDQLEWFLMQLSKGAGSLELLGMSDNEQRNHYRLVKPLLALSKLQLQNYLNEKGHHYFIDESNADESFKRNHFRHQFSDKLISQYQSGISKSFQYLKEDQALLLEDSSVHDYLELTFIRASNPRIALFHVDKALKKRGYILSHAQREELKKQSSAVISDQFVIEQIENITYIAPRFESSMDKSFKEACRVAKIPSKIRPYLAQKDITIELFKKELEKVLKDS